MSPRPRVSRSRPIPAMAEVAPATPVRAPAKKAARSRALSVETLEQLGARQLAELLMAQAQSDPALARSLRLVLAATDGGGHGDIAVAPVGYMENRCLLDFVCAIMHMATCALPRLTKGWAAA